MGCLAPRGGISSGHGEPPSTRELECHAASAPPRSVGPAGRCQWSGAPTARDRFQHAGRMRRPRARWTAIASAPRAVSFGKARPMRSGGGGSAALPRRARSARSCKWSATIRCGCKTRPDNMSGKRARTAPPGPIWPRRPSPTNGAPTASIACSAPSRRGSCAFRLRKRTAPRRRCARSNCLPTRRPPSSFPGGYCWSVRSIKRSGIPATRPAASLLRSRQVRHLAAGARAARLARSL